MKRTDTLTFLQKKALIGEVSFLIYTAPHDDDLKLRLYILFQEINKECLSFAIEIAKNLTTLDNNEIDRISLEASLNKVPLWLWINKVISDIKESITLGELIPNPSRVSIKKKLCKEKLIESAFINFAREALRDSPQAVEQLCDKILEDRDLSFLKTSCFYINSCCQEVSKNKRKSKRVSPEIMNHFFDIRDILRYRVETESLKALNRTRKEVKKEEAVTQISFNLETQDPAVLSQYLSDSVEKIFSQLNKEASIRYVVKKSYKDSAHNDEFIKEFETREEAEKFAQKIKENFPDLKDICTFPVVKEVWKKRNK